MLSQPEKIFSIEATYLSERDKRFLIKHFRFFSFCWGQATVYKEKILMKEASGSPKVQTPWSWPEGRWVWWWGCHSRLWAGWGYHFTWRNVGNHTPISTLLQSTDRSSHRPFYQMSFPAETRLMNGFLQVQFSALQNQLFWSLICPFLTQQIWQLWRCAWHQL